MNITRHNAGVKRPQAGKENQIERGVPVAQLFHQFAGVPERHVAISVDITKLTTVIRERLE